MLTPFRGFRDIQSEMDRMFDQVLGNVASRSGRSTGGQMVGWAPAIDVASRDGDLVIHAELPGVKQEDVDITLSGGVLTISGERKAASEDRREGGYYVRERRYGSFQRSMTLPEGVDENSIHARFEDGVLEVTIAGAAAVREPKRIQIEGPSE
jgi:HSP20 family protein